MVCLIEWCQRLMYLCVVQKIKNKTLWWLVVQMEWRAVYKILLLWSHVCLCYQKQSVLLWYCCSVDKYFYRFNIAGFDFFSFYSNSNRDIKNASVFSFAKTLAIRKLICETKLQASQTSGESILFGKNYWMIFYQSQWTQVKWFLKNVSQLSKN